MMRRSHNIIYCLATIGACFMALSASAQKSKTATDKKAVPATPAADICGCVAAWQQQTPTAKNCPAKDKARRFDRTGESYILYQTSDYSADAKAKEIAGSMKACLLATYKLEATYDQVQMNQVYAFQPVTVTGNRMEVRVRSLDKQTAVLLHIVQALPLPGSDSAFKTATLALTNEWRNATKEKTAFKGPAHGWNALYPGATFTGADTIADRSGKHIAYNYDWQATNGDGQALQQALLKALAAMPSLSGNAMHYKDDTRGSMETCGYRLLAPNPPLTLEVGYDRQLSPHKVSFRIIANEEK